MKITRTNPSLDRFFFAVAQTTDGFPASIDDLVWTGEHIGGTTGAQKMKDPKTGQIYVLKRGPEDYGTQTDHIRNEYALLNYLRALGQRVPEAKLYETPKGPAQLTKWVDGKRLSEILKSKSPLIQKVKQHLRNDVVTHGIAGNWDMTGTGEDNVLVNEQGEPTYIDVGGAGPFRAMGEKKTKTDWNENTSYKDIESIQSRKPHIYDTLSPQEIAAGLEKLQKQYEQALSAPGVSPELADMLRKRYQSALTKYRVALPAPERPAAMPSLQPSLASHAALMKLSHIQRIFDSK